jgi:hypothetical protein
MRGHLVYVTSTSAAEALAASSSASGASSSSVPAWISSGGSPACVACSDQVVGPGGRVGVGAGAGVDPVRVEQDVAVHQVRVGAAVAAEIEPRRQQDAAGRRFLPFVAHRQGQG